MGIFYNNTNIPTSSNIYLNNQSANIVRFNNEIIWKKETVLWPGNTFQFRTDAKGMYDYPPQAYASGNTLILKCNGYGHEAATCIGAINFAPYSTLTFTMNGSARYAQLWFGVFAAWTNLSGANQIKATKFDGDPVNVNGSYTVDVSGVTGTYNAQVFLRTGGSACSLSGQINITKISLS